MLGIVGWVRNLANGQVEAVVVGDPTQVDSMMKWFYEGPPAAKVTAVEAEEKTLQQFEDFEVRR